MVDSRVRRTFSDSEEADRIGVSGSRNRPCTWAHRRDTTVLSRADTCTREQQAGTGPSLVLPAYICNPSCVFIQKPFSLSCKHQDDIVLFQVVWIILSHLWSKDFRCQMQCQITLLEALRHILLFFLKWWVKTSRVFWCHSNFYSIKDPILAYNAFITIFYSLSAWIFGWF